jgi:hypothetical protein
VGGGEAGSWIEEFGMLSRSTLACMYMSLVACAGSNASDGGAAPGERPGGFTSVSILMVNASGGQVAASATELPTGEVRPGYSALDAGRNGYVGFVVDPTVVRSITVTFHDSSRQRITCPTYALPRRRKDDVAFTVELMRAGDSLACRIGRPPEPEDPRLQER